jgi:hypothetical protein
MGVSEKQCCFAAHGLLVDSLRSSTIGAPRRSTRQESFARMNSCRIVFRNRERIFMNCKILRQQSFDINKPVVTYSNNLRWASPAAFQTIVRATQRRAGTVGFTRPVPRRAHRDGVLESDTATSTTFLPCMDQLAWAAASARFSRGPHCNSTRSRSRALDNCDFEAPMLIPSSLAISVCVYPSTS